MYLVFEQTGSLDSDFLVFRAVINSNSLDQKTKEKKNVHVVP